MADTAPVAFGAIAIPITTLAQVTGLPRHDLSVMVGRQCPLLALVLPTLLVFMVDGRRGVREAWPAALTAGAVFAAMQFTASNYISPELTDILAALSSAAALVALLLVWSPRSPATTTGGAAPNGRRSPEPPDRMRRSSGAWPPTRVGRCARADMIAAFAPYAIIILVLGVCSLHGIAAQLDAATDKFNWPGLHVLNGAGKSPSSVVFKLNWLTAAGTQLLVAGVLSAAVLRVGVGRAARRLRRHPAPPVLAHRHRVLGPGAGLRDEPLRSDDHPGDVGSRCRRVLRLPLAADRMVRHGGDRVGHVEQLPVRGPAGGGGQARAPEAGAHGGGQQLGRRPGQDGLAPEPGHRGGRRGAGRPGGRPLPQGDRLEPAARPGHGGARPPPILGRALVDGAVSAPAVGAGITSGTRSMSGPAIEMRGPVEVGWMEILSGEALAFLAELQGRFGPRRAELLRAREERRARLRAGEQLDFLEETREVREGDWRVAPAPGDLEQRWVEITGPTDRKLTINALNSGADGFMADFEDANAPTWQNMVEGHRTMLDAVEGTITYDSPDGSHYELGPEPATLLVRPRGWHLPERHLLVDGEPMAGALMDFGLYLFHCGRRLIERGSGPYLYLPKLESHLEARLWNDVFCFAQDELEIPHGTIKATVLIETLPAAFEMEEILYELRDHSAGLNAGRWDYIFSAIKCFPERRDYVLPDRGGVTMTVPFMRAYAELLAATCHRRGAHAMGGMAAIIPSRSDEEANEKALAGVRADKEREVEQGYDGTWVAHPDLVPVARDVFARGLAGRPNQLERRPQVAAGAGDLLDLASTPGSITEQGLRTDVAVGFQYVSFWLAGRGAAAIDGLMEDAATAEISRTQIWQWVHHAVQLQDGRTVTPDLVRQVIDEETAKIREQVGEETWRAGRPRRPGDLRARGPRPRADRVPHPRRLRAPELTAGGGPSAAAEPRRLRAPGRAGARSRTVRLLRGRGGRRTHPGGQPGRLRAVVAAPANTGGRGSGEPGDDGVGDPGVHARPGGPDGLPASGPSRR